MKSDPYRENRFYLIIIIVHVKTPKSNTIYYFAANSKENINRDKIKIYSRVILFSCIHYLIIAISTSIYYLTQRIFEIQYFYYMPLAIRLDWIFHSNAMNIFLPSSYVAVALNASRSMCRRPWKLLLFTCSTKVLVATCITLLKFR